MNISYINTNETSPGSSDDYYQLPDSLIESWRLTDPEDVRLLFTSIEHINVTAACMANEIMQSLCFGRRPSSRPLLKAVKSETGELRIDVNDETGFNQTLMEQLDLSDNNLHEFVAAHLGGFAIRLESVNNLSQLNDREREFDVVPFPALRMQFDPIDY